MEVIAERPQCDEQASRLALEVGCLTEDAMGELARVKPGTLKAWRKRGIGPPYAQVGNVPLYPVEAVRRWISERVRAREAVQ